MHDQSPASYNTFKLSDTTLTRTSNAVHGDGNGLVCLTADSTQRHATGAEAAHDIRSRLNLIDGDGCQRALQLEAVSQHVCWAGSEVLLVCIEGGLRSIADEYLRINLEWR